MPLILFLVLEMSDLILILTAPTLPVGFSLEVSVEGIHLLVHPTQDA